MPVTRRMTTVQAVAERNSRSASELARMGYAAIRCDERRAAARIMRPAG